MIIIGLTGSIGMGKTTVAGILKKLGYPVYSADEAVHHVLKKGGKAVKAVAKIFPESLKRGAIDRKILGKIVFGQPRKLRQLEKIIHPLLRDIERKFLQKARKKKAPAAILEIPLLFETGADKRCDITLCVTAPAAVQRARVLARKGMTKEKLKAILARQMSNKEKCAKADYVVPTGTSRRDTEKFLRKLFDELLS